jgi:hypothetical protein
MDYAPLDVFERITGMALVPAPVKLLGRNPELDYEIAGQVLRLDFAALFSPEASAPSSSPMMMRASEPPMKLRRSFFDPVNISGSMTSAQRKNIVSWFDRTV